MVRPGREPRPPDDNEGDGAEGADTADVANEGGEGAAAGRGDAFRRALDQLPPRAPAPRSEISANGGSNGNGHSNGQRPAGAPPKLTSPDEITAPRLEASLANLLGSTTGARTEQRTDPPKRAHTLPPPMTQSRTQRGPGATKSTTKVTRIVVPRPPTETRNVAKLPPLKPTRLLKPPVSKPDPAATPHPGATPGAPPAATPPEAPAPIASVPIKPPAKTPAAAAIHDELAAVFGDAETTIASKPQSPSPQSPPPQSTPPPPTEKAKVPGEATNEFEHLLAGLLESRDGTAVIPPAAGTSPSPVADTAAAGPGDDTGGFSADVQIFPGQQGSEGNLSDFVSKILDEFDSIVEAPAGPPEADSGPPPRSGRETVAFEEGATEAPRKRKPPKAPGRDTRSAKETGEFEEGSPASPSITTDDLSALSDLFNEE